jgi:hypothetical protein
METVIVAHEVYLQTRLHVMFWYLAARARHLLVAAAAARMAPG